MSFSTVTRDPDWGTALSGVVTVGTTPPDSYQACLPEDLQLSDFGAAIGLAAVNSSGVNKPLAGWITYSGGGGGGPVRPTSGMIYPRGTG